MSNGLKVFTYDPRDGDAFVAESAEEAARMCEEEMGINLAEEHPDHAWVSYADDETISITNDDNVTERLTAAEWCQRNGKGYLFSKNY
jgi:hypothetical protein